MAEDSRYYWIKLRTDFFNQDTIDFLISQKNGCEYVVLYQMLCLNTANNSGELSTKIGEIIAPYTIDKIVRDTKYFDFDTVTVAIELFKKLGLVYESDESGILTIANYKNMIGIEPDKTHAERQKRYRERQKQKKLESNNLLTIDKNNVTERNDSDVTHDVTERNDSDIDIRYKRLEIRDKNININNTPENSKKTTDKKQIESEFEQLWKMYPRKEEKKRALTAYIKARTRKESPCTFEQVREGIEKYRKHTENSEMRYIKQGANWFNGECWNDEYIDSEHSSSKHSSPKAEDYDFSDWYK